MEIKNEIAYFKSGRAERPNCGIIGLSPEGLVCGGYDDGFPLDGELTNMERLELANYMIKQWAEFGLCGFEDNSAKMNKTMTILLGYCIPELYTRVSNLMRRLMGNRKYLTVGDLNRLTDDELLSNRGIGIATVFGIRDAITDYLRKGGGN